MNGTSGHMEELIYPHLCFQYSGNILADDIKFDVYYGTFFNLWKFVIS